MSEPMTQPEAGGAVPAAGAEAPTLADDALRDRLAKVERKPPLYRAYRVALYASYVAVATYLVLVITIAVWRSVYGEAGEALRRSELAGAARADGHSDDQAPSAAPPAANSED